MLHTSPSLFNLQLVAAASSEYMIILPYFLNAIYQIRKFLGPRQPYVIWLLVYAIVYLYKFIAMG